MKKLFLLALGILLLNCSKSDDSTTDYTVISTILDKWWYASYCCTSDIYVHSDGKYVQRDPESNEITDTGNWILVDEKLTIIKIDYDEGTEQTLSTFWLKFGDIQEHTVDVFQSSDGTNFYPVSTYQDTDI